MGTDITMLAEARAPDGTWYALPEACDTGRCYDLFAILAGVRNGTGFAGARTGSGFQPISAPRGVPEDASPSWRAEVEYWGEAGHSHSWLALDEILAFDWTQVTMKTGIVSVTTFVAWRDYPPEWGNSPDWYAGDVGGPGVLIFDEETAGAVSLAELQARGCTHVSICWEMPYARCARDFWTRTMPMLFSAAYTNKLSYHDIRLVFLFDS